MANTVVGFFDNATEAQNAVQQLLQKGFTQDSIDVSSGNSGNTGTTTGTSYTDTDTTHESGITRFFKGLFGDNDEADRYAKVGQRSGAIVTVHAQSKDEAERAADLLDDYGAVNVDDKASEYGIGSTSGASYQNGDRTGANLEGSGSYQNSDRTGANQEGSIPVVREELEVGKRTVETGGVRVRSRIVETPVEESIRLREEQVRVERTPVNRVASTDDLTNFQDKDIELTERSEVPVVNKQARVVEEIRVSKEVNDREETIRDTVRNTEVDVENLNRADKSDLTGTTGTNRDDDLTGTNRNNDLTGTNRTTGSDF